MNAPGLVLVGVDEGGAATSALDWAVELCDETNGELLAVTAVSPDQAEIPPSWHAELIRKARGHLRHEMRVATGDTRHRSLVVGGDAAEVIHDAADDENASVVILGAPRAESAGQVAQALSHHLSTPLVIVPEVGGPLAEGNIVVGLDGSDGSQAALEWAAAIATSTRASLHAVYAYDPLADSYPHGPTPNWKYRGQADVEAQVNALSFDGDITLTLMGADPITALAQVGSDDNAALVVVGTKGLGGLNGLVLGRVPAQLPQQSHRPVAVIHHRGDARPPVKHRGATGEVASGWHRLKGRVERFVGWLTADRRVEAEGEAELRVGHDPAPRKVDRVEREISRRYGETVVSPTEDPTSDPAAGRAMETMLDAIARLRAAGYRTDLEALGAAKLRCGECDRAVDAHRATVDEIVRFEGASNPGDESILLAVTTPCGHRGTFSAAFGSSATRDDADVLHALTTRKHWAEPPPTDPQRTG